MGIHISLTGIWTHQRHVMERRNQKAIIEHAQVNVLL
jgi:hypothetical protein